jgi:hypothetical protein
MRQIKSKSTGGAREGAGRPPGRANVATQALKATLSELAREHTQEALGVVLQVMRGGDTDAIRLAAANVILDRGYGRPQAALEVTAAPAEADWDRMRQAVASLTLQHLEAIHDAEGMDNLADVPTPALEALMIVADAGGLTASGAHKGDF